MCHNAKPIPLGGGGEQFSNFNADYITSKIVTKLKQLKL